MIHIILDKYDLRPYLEFKLDWRRHHRFREIAVYSSVVNNRIARQFLKMLGVDEIHGIARGGKGYGKTIILSSLELSGSNPRI